MKHCNQILLLNYVGLIINFWISFSIFKVMHLKFLPLIFSISSTSSLFSMFSSQVCVQFPVSINSIYTDNQSKHCLHVYSVVCVCIFISVHQSSVLFFSWHIMTEVFVDILWLADCHGKVMPSQWPRTGKLEEMLHSGYEGSLQGISVSLRFRANACKHECHTVYKR